MIYLAYKYATDNIGDEIQSLAATRILPKVDKYIFRDELDKELEQFQVEELSQIRMLFHGWFSHQPDNFFARGKTSFRPLPISVHLANCGGANYERSFDTGLDRFLREISPIGCRDLTTLEILRHRNIDAYFSGCLSLTLSLPLGRTNDSVVVSDLKTDLPLAPLRDMRIVHRTHTVHKLLNNFLRQFPHKFLPWKLTRQDVYKLSRLQISALLRRWAAYRLLRRYRRAKLVLTSRLHCALPCLAMGTNVIFVPKKPNDPRFAGYEKILRAVSPEDLANAKTFEDLMSLRSIKTPYLEHLSANIRKRALQYLA